MRGKLIALEGGEASGKSTQAKVLSEQLGAVLTYEPGATELGSILRKILLGSAELSLSTPPVERSEALLMMADRAEHVARIVAPALKRGDWVVSDRFVGSTLAYQGWGRGLDADELLYLSSWASQGIQPDLTILLVVSPHEALRRRSLPTDQIEASGDEFFKRVAAGYQALAQSDPNGWATVLADGPVEEVAQRIRDVVVSRLGMPGALSFGEAGVRIDGNV